MLRRMVAALGLAVATGGLAVSVAAQRSFPERSRRRQEAMAPLYDNLGRLHHSITTNVPLAQRYFDQGLRLAYAFNHAEAIASFRQAWQLDSTCAMCWWGVAWASGPNLNAAMDSAAGAVAYDAVQRAVRLRTHASPKHRAFINAMAQRYGPNFMAHPAALDSAYATAMARVAQRYPGDPEAQVLYAEALMLLSPWDYWTPDRAPRRGTKALLGHLAGVMTRTPEHVGACHFYIHAVEAAYPERAIPCAERLPSLMPGAGHIVHMPSHVFVRVGRYVDAIAANIHAVHADEAHIAERRMDGPSPPAYDLHNYHFLSFAAQMVGQRRTAIDAALALAAKVDPAAMRVAALATLQHLHAAPYSVLVRFGAWETILAMPAPGDDGPYSRGIYLWAHGMALARRGDTAGARRDLEAVTRLATDARVAQIRIFNITPASHVLQIAARILDGELAAAAGNWSRAVALHEEAVRLEDALADHEPPTWELSARHLLGATLLSAGRPAAAEAVYRRDLRAFPENGWALFGLAQALRAQGKNDEAARVERRFRHAWRAADVTLTASRF